jgi:Zn finger protein HypA/HybF involved in hydrogenase expression
METEQSNPLECSECKGVLLPERAIRLQNEICVLRYVCMGCDSRSYALKTGSRVRVYPSGNIESVTGTAS